MRKVAGWRSLRSLYLANLAFGTDWGLLRTLAGLRSLTLARGSSYVQLCELLYLLRGLPALVQLTLNGWQCARSVSGPTGLAAVAAALVGPSLADGRLDGGSRGGNPSSSNSCGSICGGASSAAKPVPAGAADTAVGARDSCMAGGGVGGSECIGSDLSHEFSDGSKPYSMTAMAAALDAPLYAAVAAMRAAPRDAPTLALAMLGAMPALTTLHVIDCANAMVAALATIPQLHNLRYGMCMTAGMPMCAVQLQPTAVCGVAAVMLRKHI